MSVHGAGIPACIICLTWLGVSDLPTQKVASGAGLQNFIRMMSMAVGVSPGTVAVVWFIKRPKGPLKATAH